MKSFAFHVNEEKLIMSTAKKLFLFFGEREKKVHAFIGFWKILGVFEKYENFLKQKKASNQKC